jgi:hypothetical protein
LPKSINTIKVKIRPAAHLAEHFDSSSGEFSIFPIIRIAGRPEKSKKLDENLALF